MLSESSYSALYSSSHDGRTLELELLVLPELESGTLLVAVVSPAAIVRNASHKLFGTSFAIASSSSSRSFSKYALLVWMYRCSFMYWSWASLRFCTSYVGGIEE
jgi:hypothetical protein